MSSASPGRAWPLHPLLFAAYAVLFLFAQNVAEVGLRDVIPPLGRAVIGAGAVLAAAGLVYRDLRRGALVASALLAAFLGHGHVAGMVGAPVSREVLLVTWGVLIATVAIVAWRASARRIASVTLVLDAIAGVLVLLTLVQVLPPTLDAIGRASAALPDRPAPDPDDPDIWFLVFDRYGSADSIRRLTGVDNDLPAFLGSRGFSVAPDALANYGRTSLSLAATLDMAYLDDLVARLGPESEDTGPLHAMLQDHAVGRFLRERGYRLYQLGSWFTPTASSAIADVVLQPGRETDFEVLLRATTLLPVLDDLVTRPTIGHDDNQHREFGLFQFRELERLRAEPGPKFVFAHILLPHPPYVFTADGRYPTEAERGEPEPERYAEQLAYTNVRIRELVDQLLDAPADRQPVVVIAADEGPYPAGYGGDRGPPFDWTTASDDELRIKQGILQAIHLPDGVDASIPTGLSPVNTFRLLFDRLFAADLPLLPDRVFTSRSWALPYDLTEVTDRLASPSP